MRLRGSVLGCVALVFVWTAQADTLEMKNGTLLRGAYQGGTATTVRFKTDKGIQTVATSDILALTFEGKASAAPAASSATSSPAASGSVTVPIGTMIMARNVDVITSNDPKGKKFEVTVDTAVNVGSAVAIPAGTKGYGVVLDSDQAGRVAGQSKLQIALVELVLDGKTVAIRTDALGGSGKRSGGKVLGGAAFGAAIGAITGDAGKGAAIGATVGAAKKGQAIGVPAKTLIEFTLSSPLIVP